MIFPEDNDMVHTFQNASSQTVKNRILATIIRKYHNFIHYYSLKASNRVEMCEMKSVCIRALYRAAELFDPSKGVSFKRYATMWVRAYYEEALRESFTIHIPHNVHVEISHYKKKANQEALIQSRITEFANEGIELSYEQAKDSFNGVFLPDSLVEVLGVNNIVDIDKPKESTDNNLELSEVIEQTCFESSDLNLIIASDRKALIAAINTLEPQQFEVITRMYGMYPDTPPQGLREVGLYMGYSHERIRQIRDKGLNFLKRVLSNQDV